MADTAGVAEHFFDAWTSKDFVTGVEKQEALVVGDDTCVTYDLKTAPVPSARTREWYRVSDGKIASVSAVFDARPFAPLFEAPQAE